MSAGPFGTVAGVQLAGVFQSLLTGSRSQVALSAAAAPMTKGKKRMENRAGLTPLWQQITAIISS
jgi:hypothetical protein